MGGALGQAVFVLAEFLPWEGQAVLGCYSTREKAQQAWDTLDQHELGYLWISKIEIDAPAKYAETIAGKNWLLQDQDN